jgi:hypothetical protein
MLSATLLYLLQPAYAGTSYIIDLHYEYEPSQNTKFEGYSEDTNEAVAAYKSKEDAELKFANYLNFNKITINKAYGDKLIKTLGGDGENNEMYMIIRIYSYIISPTQAEIEAERLSKIKSDIEDANRKLSQLNSNIAEATIRLSKSNSHTETNYKSNDDVTDNPLYDILDIDYSKKKKYNTSVLAFGMPMMFAGVVCASIVAAEDIRMSSAINQPIKSLYDGHDHYDSNGLHTNLEWSDETKVEHKKLGIAGALLGGTGLIITTLGFAW